jgi:hypothetical protein
MPANIRETKIAFGYKRQSALQTANVVGDLWSLTKTNATLSETNLVVEDDAQDIGKGNEFASQVFLSHWDTAFSMEKYITSEIMAWVGAFGLGNRVKTGTAPVFTYTCTPQDPVAAGIELPAFSFIEAIRPGGSAVLDRMLVGNVVEGFMVTLATGPGRQSAKINIDLVGCGKITEPSGLTIPSPFVEHSLPAGSATVIINGVNYVSNRNLVSLEWGFRNNTRLDSGFYPGSGSQDNASIRGRMEFGDRAASLKFVARFENGSTELATLKAQTTGTAVIGLQGALISGSDYHSTTVTFHKVAFRTATIGDADGLVTVEVECSPLWHPTNGLLTMVTKCEQDGIGNASGA